MPIFLGAKKICHNDLRIRQVRILFSVFLLDKYPAWQYNSCVPFGPVAQLGAHYIRIVGVVGSNPIRSTKSRLIESVSLLFLSALQFIFENTIMNKKRQNIYRL